jgi:hypothetical protein
LRLAAPIHAREVLEGTWKVAGAEERELWRGLDQIAVGLTHAQRWNPVGAVRLLRRVADRVGHPTRLVGDVIERAAQQARGSREVGDGAIVGHPASAGRATGPVRIVHGTQDFAVFRDGDVLAAHASREYAIPAVVGTGDATQRLDPGQPPRAAAQS